MLNQNRRELSNACFALIAGAISSVAFAPFNAYWLLIITPILMLALWQQQSAKRAAWLAWLYGVGLFGAGCYWIYISLHFFGGLDILLGVVFTALFAMLLALFPALAAYLLNTFFKADNTTRYILAFPCLWVLSEGLRSYIFTGFPWLSFGYAFVATPLAGYAPLIGVYGISFLICLSSGILFNAARLILARRRQGVKARPVIIRRTVLSLLLLTLIWLAGDILMNQAWTYPDGNRHVPVTMIQANIPQRLKWQPSELANTLKRFEMLSAKHWPKRGIMLWPEAAVPLFYRDAYPWLRHMQSVANHHDSALVLGIPRLIDNNHAEQAYNSLIALGRGHGHYDKRHLVPFGEYVPLKDWLANALRLLDVPMSDFSAGNLQQAPVWAVGIPLASFICYENAYPNLLQHDIPPAKLLVTISNDAWFGQSVAAWQHLQIARMRSLESGRYQLALSNGGPSAIIGPDGQTIAFGKAFRTAIITGYIKPMLGVTPFVQFGVFNIFLIIFILLVSAYFLKQE